MDIRLKRVYEQPSPDDGTRVLVDRVWPRGRTREQVAADLWLKAVAPSSALRKWFGHDPARWEKFRARYRAELAGNPEAVAELRKVAVEGRVTLLYAARDTRHNHAIVLREYLLEAK